MERIGEILPEDKIRELLNRKFNKQYSNDYIYQELAYALNDAPFLISLLEPADPKSSVLSVALIVIINLLTLVPIITELPSKCMANLTYNKI